MLGADVDGDWRFQRRGRVLPLLEGEPEVWVGVRLRNESDHNENLCWIWAALHSAP